MSSFFNLISGICWGFAYVLAIVRGNKHKTWCIPKLAICQNFAWEFWIVISRFVDQSPMNVSFATQLICLVLDFGILLIWLIYDRDKPIRPLLNLALFVAVMAIMYFVAYFLEKWEFIAFLINLIMSILFITRAARSPGPWMSWLIGFSKMLGTLAATIVCGFLSWNPVILWIGGLCFLFDIQYLTMFSIQRKGKGTIS